MTPSDFSPEFLKTLATMTPEARQSLLDGLERDKTAAELNREKAERERLLAEMRHSQQVYTSTNPNTVEYFSFDALRGLIQRGYK